MDQSTNLAELATALAKAQGEISAARREANNPGTGKRYADLPAVWEAIRAPLSRNGLSVVQLPCEAPEGQIALRTVLLHSSGEWIASIVTTQVVAVSPKQNGLQALGSALTYLRRYALSAAVGVVSEEDDDAQGQGMGGNSNGHQSAPAPTPRPGKGPAPTSAEGGPLLGKNLPVTAHQVNQAQSSLAKEMVAHGWSQEDVRADFAQSITESDPAKRLAQIQAHTGYWQSEWSKETAEAPPF